MFAKLRSVKVVAHTATFFIVAGLLIAVTGCGGGSQTTAQGGKSADSKDNQSTAGQTSPQDGSKSKAGDGSADGTTGTDQTASGQTGAQGPGSEGTGSKTGSEPNGEKNSGDPEAKSNTGQETGNGKTEPKSSTTGSRPPRDGGATNSTGSSGHGGSGVRKPAKKFKPVDRKGVNDITFDDLKLDIKEDVLYEPAMLTDRAKSLVGVNVTIRGFMFPGVPSLKGITSFPLMRNTQCKFGPGAEFHHNIQVVLAEGTKFRTRPMTIKGKLELAPFNFEGKTYSLYKIRGKLID